uniref:Uncharacterized protein n=1 Tax=Romanomermis culicivorax TaxID=13658 RepID=A0A915L6D8_ROMCU
MKIFFVLPKKTRLGQGFLRSDIQKRFPNNVHQCLLRRISNSLKSSVGEDSVSSTICNICSAPDESPTANQSALPGELLKDKSVIPTGDPMDKDLQGLCEDHNYDLQGDNCQQINAVIEEIINAVIEEIQLKLNDMTFSNHLDRVENE